MGQGTDRNIVDPGFGDRPHVLQGHAAGGLEPSPTMHQAHRLGQHFNAHVVQQEARNARVERFPDVLQRSGFDLDLEGGPGAPRPPDGLRKGAGEVHVVVLDQDHVVEAEAMVGAASPGDGEFVKGAQPRGRLSGIENPGVRAGDGIDESAGQRGDSRHPPQEVEGCPFRCEDCARRALDLGQECARRHALAFLHSRRELDSRIVLAEHRSGHVQPGDDTVLFGNQMGAGPAIRGHNSSRGHIATADVLRKGETYGVLQTLFQHASLSIIVYPDEPGPATGRSRGRPGLAERRENDAGGGLQERTIVSPPTSEVQRMNASPARSPSQVQPVAKKILDNLERVVVGKPHALELVLTGLLCQGHVLIEDVPGVGKTILARALAQSLGCTFSRVQFTPDLLPSDITGTSVFDPQSRQFQFRPGPLMAQVVLADEINRATPKTQSALLEAMEERQITIDGVAHVLPEPFMVIGTQNPIEYEGTFPLPEGQLDRFLLRIRLGYLSKDEEIEMAERQLLDHPLKTLKAVVTQQQVTAMQAAIKRVHVSPAVKRYIVDLIFATRDLEAVYLGSSPRGTLGLFRGSQALAALQGREFVLPDDVKALAEPVLAHRIILDPASRMRSSTAEQVVTRVLQTVPIPDPEPSP